MDEQTTAALKKFKAQYMKRDDSKIDLDTFLSLYFSVPLDRPETAL